MEKKAYFLLRLGVGISMLGHGAVRIPKLSVFSHWMMESFAHSPLPGFLVLPFSYFLPFAEFAVGLLLSLGWFTKQAAWLGGWLMLILIFGSAMIENWEAIPSQLIHIAFFATLIQFLPSNSWGLDRAS